MKFINIDGSEPNRSGIKKPLKILVVASALVGVITLGSTLAASINLNSGDPVEFGQGVAATAACDDEMTITPVSTFSNSAVAEDAIFAMTSIEISGIDLTPEGWDAKAFDAEGRPGDWHTNYNYTTDTWAPGSEQYPGKYKNSGGIWTDTCEGKIILLRAYTDNEEYASRTTGNNISSPLYLNGNNFLLANTPGSGDAYNSGVGFRFTHLTFVPSWNNYADSTAGENLRENAFGIDDYDATTYGEFGNQSKVIVGLNRRDEFPPSDSSWVDKITIESTDTLPDGWVFD